MLIALKAIYFNKMWFLEASAYKYFDFLQLNPIFTVPAKHDHQINSNK